jgi:hypothetical protein
MRREMMWRIIPLLITVALAIGGSWTLLASRVAALEVRVDAQQEVLADIRNDLKVIRQMLWELSQR